MRRKRMVAQGDGYYHVISRIAGQEFLMNAHEKDVLMGLMAKIAVFSGVEVLTFALMDNHFHLLVKVPREHEVDDVELVEKMRVLYGDTKTDRLLNDWEAWDRRGLTFKAIEAKEALRRRMFDLSQFCKTLKETYSMSYNHRHNHTGTIWGSRFKSIFLSPDYKTLVAVGAYIDLNPVRAEIVEGPSEYRWSGYGTAVRGNTLSRHGLCALVAAAYARRKVAYEIALEVYTSAIDGTIETLAPEAAEAGSEPSDMSEAVLEVNDNLQNPKETRVFVPEKVEADLIKGTKLSLFEMLRCKVRYFSYGLVLGPASFVRNMSGVASAKKDTSRPCECCEDVELYNARWLRGKDKISIPKSRGA